MDATYVRETSDQAWHLVITDRLPTPPGMYAIVYNERGDVVHHGEIPAGAYSPEAPFRIEIPKDGLAQQYVIKLIGVNQNFDAIDLPMTDLPFEVYGGRDLYGGAAWVMGYPTRGEVRRLAFQVKPGGGSVMFTGSGQMRILDHRGAVVVDKMDDRQPGANAKRSTAVLTLSAQPGQTYWLDPGNANQIGTPKDSAKIYFAFDPERWFGPDIRWALESRPWWKGLFKE
jgi:hypothetical protein